MNAYAEAKAGVITEIKETRHEVRTPSRTAGIAADSALVLELRYRGGLLRRWADILPCRSPGNAGAQR